MGLDSGLEFARLPRALDRARTDDRLDSWKEIANYLRREVRTVQLWEKNEGLPVHRHFHKHLGTVFAFRSEIEGWRGHVQRKDRAETERMSQQRVQGEKRITLHITPLRNLCPPPNREDFCDAMTARTLSAFREISSERINVSVGDFAEENLEANSVSAWEGTNHQLSWSMREDSADLILDVCLVDARTGAVLWTQAYRTNQVRGDEIPAQLVEQIVRCIWLKLARLPKHNTLARKNNGCASREAYLKGRYFWKQRSEECLRKAVRCFESAIQHDRNFALPYSGLADALTLLSFYEFVSPSEVMPSARRAALNAIAIDPTAAEAHVSLADVLLHFERDWQGADREYRRAIQCNPEYALGYHWYSNLLSARGQHDAAHLAITNALEIDPLSVITLVWAGFTSYLARQFDAAILHYKNALELDPNFAWTHMYLAQALEQKGNFRAAHSEFDAALRLARGNHSAKAMQAHMHAMAGDKPSAREILRELKCASSADRLPSYDIAAAYAALAEPSRMIAWLRRACQERSMKLFTLPQDPRFDSFRCRSDFREVVREIGLLPN